MTRYLSLKVYFVGRTNWRQSVHCFMFGSNCCLLTCILVSQEAGKVWYSPLFKNFSEFVVIDPVKGFDVVNEAEVVIFLVFPCFLHNPMNADDLISGSSAFSNSSLYI